METKKLLPLAAMEKILKQEGAARVSDGAKIALKEVLEHIADDIAKSAVTYATHAGRKTVKAEDIDLVMKQ